MKKAPAYCYGTRDGTYLVIRDWGHARIVPAEEALDGRHILLVYTALGTAKKALSSRVIYPFYQDGNRWHYKNDGSTPLVTKELLVILPLKLTLDIED